jgi:hypothetical protein
MKASRGSLRALAATFLVQLAPNACFAQQALDVQMQLTKSTILLGEPDWVSVKITNRSNQSLRVDTSPACFITGSKPLHVEIPAAEPGDEQAALCNQGRGGDCYSTSADIAPGETYTLQYVLDGDFRITHAGTYSVMLEKPTRYAPVPPSAPPSQSTPLNDRQTARAQITLEVLPANADKLLGIERSLVQEATAPIVDPPFPQPPKNQPYDVDALRRFTYEQRKSDVQQVEERGSIAEGLAEFPAAGMESVFDQWMITGFGYGLQALMKLNTPEARKLVAEAADPSDDLYLRWSQHVHVGGNLPVEATTQQELANWQVAAIFRLLTMGDKSYLPLLEKLTADNRPEIRGATIRGLCQFGGDEVLPFLSGLASSAATMPDRQDAILSMGETASLKAVPLLIDLLTSPYSDESEAASYALLKLTHHQIATADQSTPLKSQAAWQDWWTRNQHTARAFAPGEACASSR